MMIKHATCIKCGHVGEIEIDESTLEGVWKEAMDKKDHEIAETDRYAKEQYGGYEEKLSAAKLEGEEWRKKWGILSDSKDEDFCLMRDRAESAEAERDRHKKALEEIIEDAPEQHFSEPDGYVYDCGGCEDRIDIAKAVLGKPGEGG